MPAYRSAGSVSFDYRRNVVDPSRSLERDGIEKALAKMESVPFLEEVSDSVSILSRGVLGALGELKKNVYSRFASFESNIIVYRNEF